MNKLALFLAAHPHIRVASRRPMLRPVEGNVSRTRPTSGTPAELDEMRRGMQFLVAVILLGAFVLIGAVGWIVA